MINQLKCVKCGGVMENGFVIDYTYGGKLQSRWIEGEPERSIWTGLKTKDKTQYKVETHRCQNCGYLESYAVEQTKESSFG